MKLTLVGDRDGKPIVHWLRVVAASMLVVAAVTTGAVLMCFVLGHSFFLLPQTLAMSIPVCLGAVIGVNIKRGLQTPLS